MRKIFYSILLLFICVANSYAYKKYIVNGQTYFFPEVKDQNWGQVVTDWAGAVSSTTFQKSGGTFTLTAEAYFGAKYGLRSAYFSSASTAPIASTGAVRLSNKDSISWRNFSNNGDLKLSVDSMDRLSFNGVSFGTVPVNTYALNTSSETQTKIGALISQSSVTANYFFGNGRYLNNLSTQTLVNYDQLNSSVSNILANTVNLDGSTQTKTGGLNISGSLTANKLFGDGSGITNLGGFVTLSDTQTFTGANTFKSSFTIDGYFNLLPPGIILPYAGASTPTGFYVCDGSTRSRTNDLNLFIVIGTIYGSGDGATNFNLPNMQRRTLVGSGGAGTATLGSNVGNIGGEETHVLTTTEMPSHSHGVTDPGHAHTLQIDSVAGGGTVASQAASGSSVAQATSSNGTGISIQNSGSGAAHNIMQPSLVVNYIIKY